MEKYNDLYEDHEDDIPHTGDSSRGRIGIRKIHKLNWGGNSFDEHLAPLRGAIRKNVGRPWDKVYSEICSVFDKRSVINQHILIHLESYVTTKDIKAGDDGKLYYLNKSRYFNLNRSHGLNSYDERWELVKGSNHILWYVDPRDGILKENKARESRRVRSKASKLKYLQQQQDVKRVYANGVEIERARDNGLWYKSVYKTFEAEWKETPVTSYNYVTKAYETTPRMAWVYPNCREYTGRIVQGSRVLVEYKALNRKELKYYGVENRPVEEASEISNARLKRTTRRLQRKQ